MQSTIGTGQTTAEGAWDIQEALMWVGYNIHLHEMHRTVPTRSELVDWLNQILCSQVAISALMEECEFQLGSDFQEAVRARLGQAMSRIGGYLPVAGAKRASAEP